MRLWCVSVALSAVALALDAAGFQIELLTDAGMVLHYAYVCITAGLFGFVLALFPGGFFIAALEHWRTRVNGGPFQIGDTVQIIGGPHAGKHSIITHFGQGTVVKLDLGDEVRKTYSDYFSTVQIMRITRGTAEPNVEENSVVR